MFPLLSSMFDCMPAGFKVQAWFSVCHRTCAPDGGAVQVTQDFAISCVPVHLFVSSELAKLNSTWFPPPTEKCFWSPLGKIHCCLPPGKNLNDADAVAIFCRIYSANAIRIEERVNTTACVRNFSCAPNTQGLTDALR